MSQSKLPLVKFIWLVTKESLLQITKKILDKPPSKVACQLSCKQYIQAVRAATHFKLAKQENIPIPS